MKGGVRGGVRGGEESEGKRVKEGGLKLYAHT